MNLINDHEAYQYQLSRLTPEQQIQVNVRENNINRKLKPWEISAIFKLEPSEKITPRKRRLSDEVESHWADQ